MEQSSVNTAISPGTVAIQYIDDYTRCVGVVVGKHAMAYTTLPLSQLRREALAPAAWSLCLVLGMYPERDCSWSAFAKRGFPHYILGENRVTTPTDFHAELSLCRSFVEEGTSRGMPSGLNLRRKIFNFTPQRLETLCLVAVVQHYMAGGDEGDIPDWIHASFDNSGCSVGATPPLFDELRRAVPLDALVSA